MQLYAIVAAAFVVYMALVYQVGSWLKLQGRDLWVLRGGLLLLGALGLAAYFWFQHRKTQQGREASPSEAAGGPPDDLELLLREAEKRLAASQLGTGAKLGTLPVFFVLGGQGSTKTTTVVQSGVEPELLAGQVYAERAIVPTRSANLWFARNAIFMEAAGALASDPSLWSRLLRRLRPGRLLAMGKNAQAPRAALICSSAESLLQPGGTEAAVAEARSLHTRLNSISETMGISFPVYVLFTKLDRISFFHEYVRNFTTEEASQVLGVTLPPLPADAKRIYSEEQSARLTEAFNSLYYSLSAKRPDFLLREHDEAKLPGAYEFPREFRKIRTPLVQFLVELCRPSQLAAAPFLRGFYFTGVRPITVSDTAAAPVRRDDRPRDLSASAATGMFRYSEQAAEAASRATTSGGSRRVPQWVFLNHLFGDVLLADTAALDASGSSTTVSKLRRALLAGAGALCILLAIAFTISWWGNRGLETQALQAAHGISAAESSGANLPSVDSLTRLDTLRQSVETLSAYEREGAPLHLRWGLYAGSALYPEVRKLYFAKFHQLLFGGTQAGLLAKMKALPATPTPADDYQYAYDTLKSYLITTSNHEKSTRLYLAPLLRARWAEGRSVDPERMALAQRQFDFYSEELKYANPFSSEADSLAIERARHYLSQFAGAERVYQFMLAEANKTNLSVNFNKKFPGSAEVVTNTMDVAGAFTKGGWKAMQDSIKNADRFFNGERWVLGDQAGANVDRANLEKQLRARYISDLISQWRSYLKSSAVTRYANLQDAARKLGKISSPQSPLLAMFWLASQNTGVDAPEVVKAFKPLHTVMPPSAVDQYIVPANDAYMKALASLQISLEQIAGQPGAPTEAAASQTLANAQNAKLVTRQMAQNFGLDAEAHLEGTVAKLMEDPITNAEGLLRGLGPAELNAKGAGMCAQLSPALGKYPFDPRATAQATPADVNAAFKPKEGALWVFYDASLQKLLIRQGSQFVPDPSASVHVAPGFVRFFNRAAAFSDAAYAGGSAEPRLKYNIKPAFSDEFQRVTLTIDGQTADFTPGAPAKPFTWQTGGPHGVVVKGTYKDGSGFSYPPYEGLWAVFEWTGDADARQGSTLEWKLKTGKSDRSAGPPIRFDVDNPMLQKGYFSGLTCVSRIAQP